MGVCAGGIVRLHRTLRDHRGALEADLLRYYRVDLLDLWRGQLSWRRLIVLWRGLPGDAASVIAERGGLARFGPAEIILDEIRRDQILIATRGGHRPSPAQGSPFAKTPAEAAEAARARRRAHEEAEAHNAARLARLRARQEGTDG